MKAFKRKKCVTQTHLFSLLSSPELQDLEHENEVNDWLMKLSSTASNVGEEHIQYRKGKARKMNRGLHQTTLHNEADVR